MKIKLAILLLGLTVWTSESQADLGDTLGKAKANGVAYESQFGAVAPLFKIGAGGRIVWECWAAPAKQWTKNQALALVRQLIPANIASKPPKRKGVDGTLERYVYPNGTVAILRGLRGSYIGVEVHVAEYSGSHC